MKELQMTVKKFAGILLALSLILFFAGCKGDKDGASGVDLNAKVLVSKDASGLIVINVQGISKAGLIKEIIKDEESKSKYEEFKSSSGLDPEKDITGCVIAVFGDLNMKPNTTEKGDLYAVIKGTFDEKKIINSIKAKGKTDITENNIEGFKFYHAVPKEKTEEGSFVHFLNENTIILSNTSAYAIKGINTVNGKLPNITENKELISLYDQVDKDKMFWGLFGVPASEADPSGGMLPEIQKVKNVSFNGSYDGKELDLGANLYVPDNETSKQLTQKLTGLVEMIKSMTSQSEESSSISEILGQLEITQELNSVKLHFTITKEQMDKLQKEKSMEKSGF
jgi:hypothetical protein